MEKIITYLKQLELSEIEAKLYLTLLKSGPISVRKLAASSEMKRTTSYLYIDQLIERGLIIKVVKGSQKLVAATDPSEGLNYLVKRKVESATDVKKNLPSILETLVNAIPDVEHVEDAEIRYYNGKNGVNKIYSEALKGTELRLFLTLSDAAPLFPENDKLFENALEKSKNLKIFEIYGDASDKIHQLNYAVQNSRYFFKFLPPHVHLTSACILIYDNKIAIINLKNKITGVVLHSNDLYNNFRLLFDFIWEVLPNNNA